VRALLAVVSLGEEAAEGSWTAAARCSAAPWERRVGRGVAAMGGFGRSSGGLEEDDGNNWLGRMGPGPQRTGQDFLPWAERGG